jgi:hypothetical protein
LFLSCFRRARAVAVALVALAAVSCSGGGPALYPARGQVFVRGQPAEGAVVVLHPLDDAPLNAPKPSGRVGADGSFVLGTRAPGDGAPAGKYGVAIAWIDKDARPDRRTGELPVKLAPVYADHHTSGLSAEVHEGPNDIPAFRLDK